MTSERPGEPAADHASCVLVFGASGYIGSHLVPRLISAGYRVRACSRDRRILEARGWKGVEIAQADALRAETLDQALRGVRIAYYLVHSLAAGSDFAERDRLAAEQFREAAERAGVERIIYLGGLQSDDTPSAHLASRRETGDVLRAGAIPVTELRAGIIVGPGSAAFEVMRDLVYHLRLMVTPRWVRSRTQPIALNDLLEYLVSVIRLPATAGCTLDVGGPEVLSYEQMLRVFARVVNRRIFVLSVPVLTPRLSSYWLDLITAVPANVARPLVDGLRHDLIADDAEIRTLIPIALRSYQDAVIEALRSEQDLALPSRWAEGAITYRLGRPDISYYSKRASARADVAADAEVLWDEVARIGGATGWLYLDWLWQLRGLMDRAIGGVGVRRGRRDAHDVRLGDAIDFWRVVAVEPGRRLTLLAEMKLPGSAILEFEVTAEETGRSRLQTAAYFHPAGLPGLLYWYALAPIHGRIFRGMTAALARRAERAAAAPAPGDQTSTDVR